MNELGDLYQQVILDHNRQPRNYHRLEAPARHAVGHNPLCGDRITVYVDVRDGVIRDVGFEGSGCAISKASASMMTEALKGRSEQEVEALFQRFHRLVTGAPGETPGGEELGKLVVFSGVRDYPVRVKCATLAWHTLRAALQTPGGTATTE
ncbi:MAG TPA: SUF system NifU family Fe-S cluster assembly protein [Candidatus Polarisedimenticolia bacterium]|nr:SUF system NifU family Fe-S cluster assembly protein [Candidatus Polarisedimenticolia bacterium]